MAINFFFEKSRGQPNAGQVKNRSALSQSLLETEVMVYTMLTQTWQQQSW